MATDERCKQHLYSAISARGRAEICGKPIKATVIAPYHEPIRVCGIHARERERRMENVIWDARFDQRGTRV